MNIKLIKGAIVVALVVIIGIIGFVFRKTPQIVAFSCKAKGLLKRVISFFRWNKVKMYFAKNTGETPEEGEIEKAKEEIKVPLVV